MQFISFKYILNYLITNMSAQNICKQCLQCKPFGITISFIIRKEVLHTPLLVRACWFSTQRGGKESDKWLSIEMQNWHIKVYANEVQGWFALQIVSTSAEVEYAQKWNMKIFSYCNGCAEEGIYCRHIVFITHTIGLLIRRLKDMHDRDTTNSAMVGCRHD